MWQEFEWILQSIKGEVELLQKALQVNDRLKIIVVTEVTLQFGVYPKLSSDCFVLHSSLQYLTAQEGIQSSESNNKENQQKPHCILAAHPSTLCEIHMPCIAVQLYAEARISQIDHQLNLEVKSFGYHNRSSTKPGS